jgi:hypothetical protein
VTTRARLAGAGLACCVLLFAGSIALLLLSPEGPDFGIVAWLFAQLALAIVGGLIGLRRPGNNIGRILLLDGLSDARAVDKLAVRTAGDQRPERPTAG